MSTRMNFLSTTMESFPVGAPLLKDLYRTYLSIIATTDMTVTLSGGEPFPIFAGQFWSPWPVPSNDMTFTGTGVIITDSAAP